MGLSLPDPDSLESKGADQNPDALNESVEALRQEIASLKGELARLSPAETIKKPKRRKRRLRRQERAEEVDLRPRFAMPQTPEPEAEAAPDEPEVVEEERVTEDERDAVFELLAESLEESPASDEEDAVALKGFSDPGEEIEESTVSDERKALDSVDPQLAIRALALPVRLASGQLTVKAATPIDLEAIEALRSSIQAELVVEEAPMTEVVQGLKEAYWVPSSEPPTS